MVHVVVVIFVVLHVVVVVLHVVVVVVVFPTCNVTFVEGLGILHVIVLKGSLWRKQSHKLSERRPLIILAQKTESGQLLDFW
jgi:hypothetical protein